MKIIKISTALILTLSILTACSKATDAQTENARIVSSTINTSDHGELYTDDEGRLIFADYESLNSAFVCSKPNCTHTNAEECSAYGMNDHPILFGNYIYFFKNEINYNGQEIVKTMNIYKADKDGTNRKLVLSQNDLSAGGLSDRMVVFGDAVYFFAFDAEFDEYGASSDYVEMWLCKFNMTEETLDIIEMILEGYNGGVSVDGFWNGKIYFTYSVFDHELSYEELAAVDISNLYKYKTYDIESGETAWSEQPAPAVYVGGGYYIYAKDNGVSVISESGEETYFEGFPDNGAYDIFDDKIFVPFEGKWGDITTGKAYPLDLSYVDHVMDYFDGNYIIKSYILDDVTENGGSIVGREYRRVSEKELLGIS